MNKTSFSLASLHMLSNVGAVACNVLMPIYLVNQLQFSLAEVGFILAASGVGRALLTPVLGSLTDHFQKTRLGLFIVTLLAALILVIVFPYMTSVTVAVVAYTLYFSFQMLAFNIIDRLTNEHARNHKVTYGQIKVFGTASYVIFGVIIPIWINGGLSIQILYIAGLATLIMLIPIPFLPTENVKKEKQSFIKASLKLKDYKMVWLAILAYQILYGASNTSYYFASTYFDIWGMVWLTSFAIIMGSCISEIPSFLYYKKLERKFTPKKLIFWVLIMTHIRWLINILFPHPVVYMLTMFCHGVLFAIAYNYTLDTIVDNVSPYSRTTMLTLMSSISMIIAGLMQGVAANLLEAQSFTLYFSFFWIMTIIASVLYYILFKKSHLNVRT